MTSGATWWWVFHCDITRMAKSAARLNSKPCSAGEMLMPMKLPMQLPSIHQPWLSMATPTTWRGVA